MRGDNAQSSLKINTTDGFSYPSMCFDVFVSVLRKMVIASWPKEGGRTDFILGFNMFCADPAVAFI